MKQHTQEIVNGQRFEFGKNWNRFLAILNEERITEAECSLKQMLEVESLQGKRFLDIGSGSGLFSLAARRLGAFVHSFDYDPESVACTTELKHRYFPQDRCWAVEQGSVLDGTYLASLGTFDLVYSWGVLHHTGAMWQALENIMPLTTLHGRLFIAIYNDQGRASKYWSVIKRTYNQLPPPIRFTILIPAFIRLWGPTTLRDIARGQSFQTWRNYKNERGMSAWHDVMDWVGGYPFEVAKPEEIFDFCRHHGFVLRKLKTCAGSIGCNEYVFEQMGL